MAWELEIHIIDVGQGESTLIIAKEPTSNQQRTMLIDAGLPGYAETVHRYIVAQGLTSLDHILLSHYDRDHSGGVIGLLIADTLHQICKVIADAAGAAADAAATNGQDRDHQVAAGTAAAVAAAMGCYAGVADYSNVAVTAGQTAWTLVFATGNTNAQIAQDSLLTGETAANTTANLNPSLIPAQNKRRSTAKQAGIAAGMAGGNAAARSAVALTSVFNELNSAVVEQSQFNTGGIYKNTHLIDIGDGEHKPAEYKDVIDRKITLSGDKKATAPGGTRSRSPLDGGNVGDEIFWKTGANPGNPPANAPAIFVVACQTYIWKVKQPINSGQRDNDDSIGLILRFNNFFYYTGGDLPYQGEDLIATAVMANGLPNPAGGNFAIPPRIACFKCGHHGSNHSTSQAFLTKAKPKGAFISCGENQFGRGDNHPDPNVINRLHTDTNIEYFFLTNCKYDTTNVPASGGNDQLPVLGNKSRVSGENDKPNLQAGRNRGNIKLTINEAESLVAAAGPTRQYHVEYYEDDAGKNALRTENIKF